MNTYKFSHFAVSDNSNVRTCAHIIIGPHQTDSNKNTELRQRIRSAISSHIKFTVDCGWAEVSGKLEREFARAAGYRKIIDPQIFIDHKIFNDVDVGLDYQHYTRPVRKGETSTEMIAYGTIMF